jgi:hypothetical protein
MNRNRDLRQVAIGAFIIGVFLHACVAVAVLDGGGSGSSGGDGQRTITSGPAAPPTRTPLLDRADCSAIRGTDYRSENERQWFIRNCQ